MPVDHAAMMWAEVAEIGELLHELGDEEFDQPSLCEGWKVRDIIGHMSFGHTTPMPRIIGAVVQYRGNMTKGSFELSKKFAAARTPAELVAFWDTELVRKHSRKGIAKVIKYTEAFPDHLIHHQDIRRPLERSRDIPEERLAAVLDLLPGIKTPFFSTKPVVQGLRLVATDIGWSHGDGPAVEGPAEPLIMGIAGRQSAFDELQGDGLPTLIERWKTA
jgi:uncharacterized protein (TIGR03083 family)